MDIAYIFRNLYENLFEQEVPHDSQCPDINFLVQVLWLVFDQEKRKAKHMISEWIHIHKPGQSHQDRTQGTKINTYKPPRSAKIHKKKSNKIKVDSTRPSDSSFTKRPALGQFQMSSTETLVKKRKRNKAVPVGRVTNDRPISSLLIGDVKRRRRFEIFKRGSREDTEASDDSTGERRVIRVKNKTDDAIASLAVYPRAASICRNVHPGVMMPMSLKCQESLDEPLPAQSLYYDTKPCVKSIQSSKFARVLRLVANLPAYTSTAKPKKLSPLLQPPVWAEVSIVLTLLC